MQQVGIVIVLLAFSYTATAATFDSVSTVTSNQGSFSCPHTNSGNLLVVFVHHTGSGPSAISYRAADVEVALSKLVSQQATSPPALRQLEAWFLLSPAVGPGTVNVVTTSPRSLVTVISIKDAARSVPLTATESGASERPSVTVNAG